MNDEIKCNYCRTNMKKLLYCYDEEYELFGNEVYIEKELDLKKLYCCPNCGNVQVKINSNN